MKCTEKSGLYEKVLLDDTIIYVLIYFPILSVDDWTQALHFQISKTCDDKKHSSAKIPVCFIAILPL